MIKWIIVALTAVATCYINEVVIVLSLGGLFFVIIITFGARQIVRSWFALFDTLRFMMVLLSVLLWLLRAAIIPTKIKTPRFYLLFFSLFFSVVLFFGMVSLLGIFITFEISLIPITLIILGWGNQVERIQASIYLLFYTAFFSLPLFVVILFFLKEGVSRVLTSVRIGSSGFLIFVLIIRFFVKLPIYLVHLWLPKAHVEAPMIGSMLLAGILLKIGGYGSYRIMIWGGTLFRKRFIWLVAMWGFLGGLIGRLVCCVQEDLKRLIAIASVGHMNFIIGGLFVNAIFRFRGFLILMFTHGLVSRCLFMGGTWFYERFGTRLLLLIQGLLLFVPWSVIIFSFRVLANFAVPPFVSFIAEFILVRSRWLWGPSILIWVGLIVFFSCYYSIYFLITIIHGKWISKGSVKARDRKSVV